MSHRLAIVIPAYKAAFLDETLHSIATQTCKDFTLYIGDDHSPEDIGTIVDRYRGSIPMVYHRFEQNLGGKNLVAQWTRTVALTQGEPWIWLFSDDDIMDPECVERFYQTLADKRNEDTDLFRFDVNVINNERNVLDKTVAPELISNLYLFCHKINGTMSCYAVEYIFSRRVYEEQQGFQSFDLAWGSDTATWVKFGERGIRTLPGARVNWRKSGQNVSGQESSDMLRRKFKASIDFLKWAKHYWRTHGHSQDLFINITFLRILRGFTKSLPWEECMQLSKEYWKKY